ncbi:set domain-containing protein 5 [Colletotrichum musicola]|uniref:Set domain-containing protein 5 n=1 Tax=Colletotrichum musicola TaxID=2175873 RepID=A0A8H6N1F1_9PEZI|nr:set domain-containing protein 5 [Colletotrichum musicola]
MAKEINTKDSRSACYRCQKPTARRCGGCSGAPPYHCDRSSPGTFYCSSSCQRADWARHKEDCKTIQARKWLLRVATLLQGIMVQIRKNAYPIRVTSIEHESDTTVKVMGSLTPAEGGPSQPSRLQSLPTNFDVFRQQPDLFKSVCLSEAGAEAFVYLYNVIVEMVLDTRPSITFTEVEVAPSNQNFRVSSAVLAAACGTGGSHRVYTVAMENGELWVMDFTAAQHGYSDASMLLPWSAYVKERCESVNREWALGTHRNHPERIWQALHRQPPFGLAHVQCLAGSLDREIPILVGGNGMSRTSISRARVVLFEFAAASFVDELEVHVRYALAQTVNTFVERARPLKTGARPFCIRSAPGKDSGWFATRRISKGTRLLSESPLFILPKYGVGMEAEHMICRQVQRLNETQRTAFYALHNIHGGRHTRELGIACTKGLPLGADASEGGIFLEASPINHSCRHNAQNTWNSELGQIIIHAIRDIEAGEEITISYLAVLATYVAAQAQLLSMFGIFYLEEQLEDGFGIVATPLACLRHVHEMKQLMEEEGIQDARVARLYYDAFQIAIANGDEARAKVFAERATRCVSLPRGTTAPTLRE